MSVKYLAILLIALLLPTPLLRAQDFSNPAGYLLAQSEERQVWVNTVLACVVADLIAGGVFHGLFLRPIERRFGVFLTLLFSYVVVASTTVWYFGFAKR
jgi:hypothetical protein